jgi:hypothetical protein
MTSWAYEFNVSPERFDLFVDVPSTLDMYEARVYPMANLKEKIGEAINDVLIPWEGGLYAEHDEDFGGYNMDDGGYRAPEAFASCEHLGQDMTLDHNNTGNTLYHLVLIAEHGAGKVKFYVKTDFESPVLKLIDEPKGGYVLEPTPITVSVEDETPLRSIYIEYTTDGRETWSYLNMTHVSENKYTADIPPLAFGKKVEYSVVAVDQVDNAAEVEGKFSILESRPEPTSITSTLSDQKIKLNKPIEVSGGVVPYDEGIKVTVRFISSATSHRENVVTSSGGTYTCSFKPPEVGTWSVLVEVSAGDGYEASQAPLIEFEVAALNALEKIVVMFVGALVMMMKPPYQYIVYGVVYIVGIFAAYKISGRIRNR